MDLLTLTLAAGSFMETVSSWASFGRNIVWVAVGLGLVIFFHELGHFAVAKWCNVNVERFSIGFGPILFSWKWGETEYALSAIPFGGYVKMLGQDDADPSQLTSEEIAQDPRSYLAKNVFQRMAIISAGVTMNIITAVLFVGGAFVLGVDSPPPIVGEVRPGMPAWKAGLQPDDTIEKINDRQILTFEDVRQYVALSAPPLIIEGKHGNGQPFKLEILPEKTGSIPQIGVSHTNDLKVLTDPAGKIPFSRPGTPAANAEPPFELGDMITSIDGDPVETYWQLRQHLVKQSEGPIKIGVRRSDDSSATVTIKDNAFRTLGLSVDAGPIAAVQKGSPAEKADLQVGDKIAMVNGQNVGTEINPLKLPNLFASLHGQTVEVTVTRQPKDGAQTKKTLEITPEDLPGWTDQPVREGESIAIASIGISFHTIPVVRAVEPGSAADKAEIKVKPGSITKLKRIEFFLPPEAPSDGYEKRSVIVELEDPKDEAKSNNWGYAFWMMQEVPQRTVRLTLVEDQKERTVELTPKLDPSWPLPVILGLRMHPLLKEQKARTLGVAWAMSTNYTRNKAVSIYLTLQSLFTGRVSLKELRGPIGIATAAVEIAENGMSQLLLFLGFLSINLAVLNFLPIPVLDGGHMVFLTYEAVVRRRPSDKIVMGANYAGMAFLLSLMLFVLYLDLFVHPFKK